MEFYLHSFIHRNGTMLKQGDTFVFTTPRTTWTAVGSVRIATCYELGVPGIETRWGGETFRILPNRPRSPPIGTGSFPRGKGSRGLALTTNLHLAKSLKK